MARGTPDTAHPTLDPRRTLLTEKHQGTFAELVTVPAHNVLPKPAGLSFAEAACSRKNRSRSRMRRGTAR